MGKENCLENWNIFFPNHSKLQRHEKKEISQYHCKQKKKNYINKLKSLPPSPKVDGGYVLTPVCLLLGENIFRPPSQVQKTLCFGVTGPEQLARWMLYYTETVFQTGNLFGTKGQYCMWRYFKTLEMGSDKTWLTSWVGDKNKLIRFWFRSGFRCSLSVGYKM